MHPHCNSLDADTGVEIVDQIERCRFVLYTSREVSPTPATTDGFAYPVSAAYEVVTESITLPYNVPSTVRDADGSLTTNIGHGDVHDLDADSYLLELSAPIKLYVRVESSITVDSNTDRLRFEFGGPTAVRIGARSYHTAPAGTVTVPDDPAAVMEAVSTFGSALKTTSCERSWPTLRGHPPRLERGDELAIPDSDALAPPETGVAIRVPPEYESVYAVAPLAYYLGAALVPDERPRITAETGFAHRLDTDRGFEAEAIRVLRQVFTLDCATRTEGLYPMDLRARRALDADPAVPLDFEALYDASLAEQLEAYLSVPFSAVEDAIPTWDRVVHLRPDTDALESLPFVANDLSLVRVESPVSEDSPDRDGSPARDPSPSADRQRDCDAISSFKRGQSADGRRGVPGAGEYVPLPEPEDAVERAWIGDGTPIHGTKVLPAAFDRKGAQPSDAVIDVTVVCNDDRMREEWDAVSNVYGRREVVPFDVNGRFGVETDDLRDLMARDTDLFHFIGHIDGRGFECPDGVLDAETLAETGATTVLLNACRSYGQGVALVEAGARAAIVSLGDVGNLGAAEVGETFARLLNYGFKVGTALEVATTYTALGRHYVALGDPNTTVAQCRDGCPVVQKLDRDVANAAVPDAECRSTMLGYGTDRYKMGGLARPYLQGDDGNTFYLIAGPLDTFTTTKRELEDLLGDYSAPVVVDGELRWTDRYFGDEAAER